jgi:hypothetical protein
MVVQLDRRTHHPLRIFGCLLVILTALLACGWYRQAGVWRVEAPGPTPNVPAISAGLASQLHGMETTVRRLGDGPA